MNPLDAWRREIRGLIPRGFVRRDQGEGLFVSDYPRRMAESAVSPALLEKGFTVEIAPEDLARIDASPARYRRLLESLPAATPRASDGALFLYALARRIEKTGIPFCAEALPTVRWTLKYMDAGDAPGLYRFLAPAAALAQREKRPLPAALGTLVLNFLKEESSC